MPIDVGMSEKPARVALAPVTTCKNSGRKMARPKLADPMKKVVAVHTRTSGSRNKLRGKTGSSIRVSNTTKIAPFIDLRARADVKGYDLVVTLVGTWPRVAATFTSDPPLSNDAILGLILSGSPPDTRQAADTTGQLVSAAGGVISGAVTGGITRRTQQLFRLDRFQIDPVFEGSNLSTFRTTIGKQITQDLAVTSSIVSTLSGNASSAVKVGVDIVHTYRGDLVIDLVAPDGTAYRLKNSSTSDSADNVVATYTVNASSEVAAGTWKLRVQDVYAGDTGYINSWNLTLR